MNRKNEFVMHISKDHEARKAAREILGVEEHASLGDIKRAYRRAAKEHHPDRHDNSKDANQKCALINCAYEMLAFGKPCPEVLEDIEARPGGHEVKYCLENSWGYFLWWREKFYEDCPDARPGIQRGNSCI